MGSKRILILILALVIFSSTAIAVDLKWALGYPKNTIGHSPGYRAWAHMGRVYVNLFSDSSYKMFYDPGGGELPDPNIVGSIDDTMPVIAIGTDGNYYTRYDCTGTGTDRCQAYFEVVYYYKDHTWYNSPGRAFVANTDSIHNRVYGIADHVTLQNDHINYKCSRPTPDKRCYDDGSYWLHYAPIISTDFDQVFVRDYTKSLGTVASLLGPNNLPDDSNETIYVGVYSDTWRDVLYWFDSSYSTDDDYPSDPKRETSDLSDYLLVCADLDHDRHCDHTQAKVKACLDEGGDWLSKPYAMSYQMTGGGIFGTCCISHEDPGVITTLNNKGVAVRDCGYYDHRLRAICGYDENNVYHWASLDDKGSITDLRGCPGWNIVSNGTDFLGCKASGTNPPTMMNITSQAAWYDWGVMNAEERICGSEADFARCTNMHDYLEDIMEDKGESWTAGRTITLCKLANCYEPAMQLGFSERSFHKHNEDSTVFWQNADWDFPTLYCPYTTTVTPMPKSINITSSYGTHSYLCDNTIAALFECAGDDPSNTNPNTNMESIALTGSSTLKLLGSGGCPNGMLAYWTFDDANATDSFADFDATVHNAEHRSDGKIDSAFRFSGTDFITAPGNVTKSGMKYLTLEAWINPEELSGTRTIIEKPNSFRLRIVDGTLKGAVWTTDDTWSDVGYGTVSEFWTHVALTYDGQYIRVYKNYNPIGRLAASGNVKHSTGALKIGDGFVGKIDEVALYKEALPYTFFKSHKKTEQNYCNISSGFNSTVYCSSEGEWTQDLDHTDNSSCEKAGFKWTGHACCSEDDDPNEFYNDYDSAPVAFNWSKKSGTVDTLPNSSSPISFILKPKTSKITIHGPARFSVEEFLAAEDPPGYVRCGDAVKTYIAELEKDESKRFEADKIEGAAAGDDCIYKEIELTSLPTQALGACWNKTFVARGSTLMNGSVLNYQGNFYGCNESPMDLVQPVTPDCFLLESAGGPDNHSVCTPGGKWMFTSNPQANASKSIPVPSTNQSILSSIGCCADDQCWDGNQCVETGVYYTFDSKSFICRE